MGIGRSSLSEEDECRITVSFFKIAKNLIVGAILLNNVDHVLERRITFARRLRPPVVRIRNPLRVLRQNTRRKVIRTRSQGSIELPQRVAQGSLNAFPRSRTI